MNIYFTASTTNDGQFKKNYSKIVSLLKKSRNKLLSGEQIVDKNLFAKDQDLSSKEIFDRERKRIDQSDCIVAEVSSPSLGVGGEVVYALVKDKPVLGLIYEKHEDKISPMISGNPSDNLFLAEYNFDKLPYTVDEFLRYVKNIKRRRGALVVIDGGNGSGKSTQGELLIKYLENQKTPTKYVHFPQYYSSFHGKTVMRFLNGEFGKIDQVSPYLSSLAYAVDRASIKKEMEDFLNKGGCIVCDRYVTSSMAHQGAKFKDKKQREEFLKWLYELEYKINKVPKENIVIYLYVPWKLGLQLKNKQKGKKTDIEEKDINHWIAAENMYLEFAKKYKHWMKIDCVIGGELLPRHEIHQEVIRTLKSRNIL